VSYAGERFDFVVTANQPVGTYWLRVRGLMDCDERFNSVHQVALVIYDGSTESESPEPLGYKEAARGGKVYHQSSKFKFTVEDSNVIITYLLQQLNPLNVGTNDNDENTITMAEVSSLNPGQISVLKAKPRHTFYLGYDFYRKDNPVFHRPQLYGFNQGIVTNFRFFVCFFT
jgi:L-ascorbate oxidase